MTAERGSITLWMVGLVMVVLAVGGIAIDLWRGLTAYRHVAAVVDAAAVAAASAIDEEVWRREGDLVLDPALVRRRVATSVGAQPGGTTLSYVVVSDPAQATITASTTVDLTLLGLLADGGLDVEAVATARPTLAR